MTRFLQARLKLKRADQHICQLHAGWQSYLETDFCEIVVEADPVGSEVIRLKAKKFPAEIALSLGDAIHNMRCALDYAVNDILSGRNTRLTFPMGETREELVAALSTDPGDPCTGCGRGSKKGRAAAIEEAVPGLGAFIVESIRPYKASGSPLWVLNKLDVRDKHRMIVPLLAVNEVTGINAVDANQNRVIDGSGSVGAGGVLNMFGLLRGTKIESHNKPTAEIFLHEPGIIERQPVFPTLVNMLKAVDETLASLDDFLIAAEQG